MPIIPFSIGALVGAAAVVLFSKNKKDKKEK